MADDQKKIIPINYTNREIRRGKKRSASNSRKILL